MDTLQRFVDQGLHPHLVLYGPTGSGKSRAAQWWAKTAFTGCRYLTDAAFDNGLDLFREWIDQVTKYRQSNSVCIIENADLLSTGCQQALRRILETQSDRVRFVFVLLDEPHALIPAILSRCVSLKLIPSASDASSADLCNGVP